MLRQSSNAKQFLDFSFTLQWDLDERGSERRRFLFSVCCEASAFQCLYISFVYHPFRWFCLVKITANSSTASLKKKIRLSKTFRDGELFANSLTLWLSVRQYIRLLSELLLLLQPVLFLWLWLGCSGVDLAVWRVNLKGGLLLQLSCVCVCVRDKRNLRLNTESLRSCVCVYVHKYVFDVLALYEDDLVLLCATAAGKTSVAAHLLWADRRTAVWQVIDVCMI